VDDVEPSALLLLLLLLLGEDWLSQCARSISATLLAAFSSTGALKECSGILLHPVVPLLPVSWPGG
jgi:hypothetical protein